MPDNKFQLMQEIIAMSVANNWDAAKEEWKLEFIERIEVSDCEDPETCLCGHFPIIELCHIRNSLNHNAAIVGNVCVTKFMGINSEGIFSSLRKISADKTKSISGDFANYARKNGLINDWEYEFCIDTKRKRELSENQLSKRLQINEQLIKGIKRRGI